MTHTTNHWMDSDSPPTEGVAGTARDEAGQLKETSADAARQVAGTVKDKASDVTSDVREQTRRLAHQTRDELVGQASQQKDRATNGLRSVSDELRGMAEHGQSGLGAQLARHGAELRGSGCGLPAAARAWAICWTRSAGSRGASRARSCWWPRPPAWWPAASRVPWQQAAPMCRVAPVRRTAVDR